MTSTFPPTAPSEHHLDRALAITQTEMGWEGYVHHGWDVFDIPHGGYLAALAANAGLAASGAPDVLSITTHFHRKAEVGPVAFVVRRLGGGRRLSSYLVEATQGSQPTMTATMAVADRDALSGPTWETREAPDLEGRLTAPAGADDEPFPTPAVAKRLGMRVDETTLGFAEDTTGDEAVIRATIDPPAATPTDQLLALVTCDATPPAAWNALGMSGWVPTVELTAHVRARPARDP